MDDAAEVVVELLVGEGLLAEDGADGGVLVREAVGEARLDAGGGGFLFALAKSRRAKDRMLEVLSAAGGPGRAYRFSLSLGR